MLPEGVHDHTQDWTVFMLNQTPGNTISSVLGADSDDANAGPAPEDKPELLYVLNLVRTKLDTTVRRHNVLWGLFLWLMMLTSVSGTEAESLRPWLSVLTTPSLRYSR